MHHQTQTGNDRAALQPGDILSNGRYRVLRSLGSGGFGSVYLAQDTLLREDVPIKELGAGLAGDQATLSRFLAEAKATMRLRHERIVGTHNVFSEAGHYYIVMEYLAGDSLEALLRREAQPVAPEGPGPGAAETVLISKRGGPQWPASGEQQEAVPTPSKSRIGTVAILLALVGAVLLLALVTTLAYLASRRGADRPPVIGPQVTWTADLRAAAPNVAPTAMPSRTPASLIVTAPPTQT